MNPSLEDLCGLLPGDTISELAREYRRRETAKLHLAERVAADLAHATLDQRLHAAGDWCARHGVTEAITVYIQPDLDIFVRHEHFVRIVGAEPVTPDAANECPVGSGRWQRHVRATIDGVAVTAIEHLPGPPAVAVIPESHVDHGLLPEVLAYVLPRSRAEAGRVVVHTVRLPTASWCALRGPAVGDAPVTDDRVEERVRGTRAGPSRMLIDGTGPARTNLVTVVTGPAEGHEGPVLYTAYPGPAAPREPWDPSLDDAGRLESEAFWRQHALVPADGA